MSITVTMEKKLTAMNEAVKTLNTAVKAGEDYTNAKETADAAVDAVNKQISQERIEGLLGMDAHAMWEEYIDHQFVLVYKLDQDKETSLFTVRTPDDENAATKRIAFANMDSAYREMVGDATVSLARMKNWSTMLRIFCEYVVVNRADAAGRQYVVRNAMSAKLLEQRKKMGTIWQPDRGGTVSMTKLVALLNEVVTAILPDEVAPKMLKPDVRYFASALISAKKSSTDEAGQFAVRNAASMEEFLFRAIYTRRHSLAYAFQNTQEKDKSAQQNPTVGGTLPSEYIETVEGGEVTVAAEEAEA